MGAGGRVRGEWSLAGGGGVRGIREWKKTVGVGKGECGK